jgi:hypothetical protein
MAFLATRGAGVTPARDRRRKTGGRRGHPPHQTKANPSEQKGFHQNYFFK